LSKRIRKHKTGKLTVRSGFEAKIVEQLRAKKVKFEYESLKLKYTVPEKVHTYTPDFVITRNGVIIEAKGRLDTETRKKMLWVKEAHPDLDIRILLMRDNPIRKGSKTRYSTWCEANGFPWAVGEVPDDWL
jgi:hypothetical protein